MELCRAAGVATVFELGPGDALARMMHEVIPDGDVHSLSEFHSLPGFATLDGDVACVRSGQGSPTVALD